MKTSTVKITVNRDDIRAGLPHPWLSPVSCALTHSLNIDGAEVKHDKIKLYREGKKSVVVDTPESVQRFSYLYDMRGKNNVGAFSFPLTVPSSLVMKEVA